MDNDLISRSALKQYFKDYRWEFVHREDFPKAIEMINCAPAVDAVEVVRCRECKHWNEDALACDTLPWVNSSEHANWYADDFCSYGERREDDGK